MSTSVRTRRTSENPASRPPPRTSHASGSTHESRSRWRDEITTNDAPEWRSTARRSRRSRISQDDDRKTGIAFRAPPVAPDDSISVVQSRRQDNGRKYSTVSKRTKRPTLQTRSSSLDGRTWSGSGAPLTATNVQALNERGSSVRESTTYSARKSRRASRRESNAVGDDQEGEQRTTAQQTNRSSRRRATVTGEEYEYGGADRGKSAYMSRAASTHQQSTLDTGVIAAGAAAGGAAGYAGAQSRAAMTANDVEASGTRVSRRTSRAAPATRTGAASSNHDRQITTRTGAGQSRATSSSSSSSSSTSRPSRPVALRNPFSPMSATSPTSPDSPDMEWERRVYIREYRRPSDGRWVNDRECIIRKLHAPQPPQIAAEV